MIFGKRLVCLTGILIMVVPATATSNRDQAGQAEPGLEETEPGPNVPAVTSQATLGVSDSNESRSSDSHSCELDTRNVTLKGTTPSLLKPENASNLSEKDIDTIQAQMQAELNQLRFGPKVVHTTMKPSLCRTKEVSKWTENDVNELCTRMESKLNRLLDACAAPPVQYDPEMLNLMIRDVINGMSKRMKLERIKKNKKLSASERMKECRPLIAYLELLNKELAGKPTNTVNGDGDPTEPSRVASAMNWFTTKLGQVADMLSLSNDDNTTPDLTPGMTAEQQNAGQGYALFNKDKTDPAKWDDEIVKNCMAEMKAEMDKMLATATPAQLAQVSIQNRTPKRKTSGAARLLAAETANRQPLETPASPGAEQPAPKSSDSREAEAMRKEMERMRSILEPKTKRTRSSSTNQ